MDNIQFKSLSIESGFTLVELVMVVIILGILGVFAAPKLLGSRDVASITFQNRTISILRNMQTRAMQDTRPDFCFQVNFDNANEQLGIPTTDYSVTTDPVQIAATCASTIISSSDDELQLFHIPASSILAEDINMNAIGDDGSPISTIEFDTLGRANQNTSSCDGNNGCRIQFLGRTNATVCVESEGFIYACTSGS